MTENPLADSTESVDPAGDAQDQVADEAAQEAPEHLETDTGADPADAVAMSTGDARVDDAVGQLDELDDRDLDEHTDVYDAIHADLADVLDDAGSGSA